MKKIKGFTLVEMLVVVAIIGLLFGVVLSGVSGFQASARDTRRIGNLKNIQSYLELYFNKCGRYPGDGSCGSATQDWAGMVTALTAGTTGAQVAKPSDIPSDPLPSQTYYYGVSADGLQYVIGAKLERDNNVLKNDIDGNVSNVDCEDTSRIYCIQS